MDELLSYKLYNYKLKFEKEIDKIRLSRNRIYFLFERRLNKIKKYLDKNLKKSFIVSS